jgi:hypothetical protein
MMKNDSKSTIPIMKIALQRFISVDMDVNEITGDHQRGFRRRSTADQIFCIHMIPEKTWSFIDFENIYEDDHSPSSIDEVTYVWSYTSTPKYAFMA